jgi:hypothetical protein
VAELPENVIAYACSRTFDGHVSKLAEALQQCASDAEAIRLIEALRGCWLPQNIALAATIVSGRVRVLNHWQGWRHLLNTHTCVEHAIESKSTDMVETILDWIPHQMCIGPHDFLAAFKATDDITALLHPLPLPRQHMDVGYFATGLRDDPVALARLRQRYGDF